MGYFEVLLILKERRLDQNHGNVTTFSKKAIAKRMDNFYRNSFSRPENDRSAPTITPAALDHSNGNSTPSNRLFIAIWNRAIGPLKIAISSPARINNSPAIIVNTRYTKLYAITNPPNATRKPHKLRQSDRSAALTRNNSAKSL